MNWRLLLFLLLLDALAPLILGLEFLVDHDGPLVEDLASLRVSLLRIVRVQSLVSLYRSEVALVADGECLEGTIMVSLLQQETAPSTATPSQLPR